MPSSLSADPILLIVLALVLIGFGAFLAQHIRRLLLYMRWIFIGSRCFSRTLPLDVLARTFDNDEITTTNAKDSSHV